MKEIKEKSQKQLHALLAERREEIRVVRFRLASNQEKNVKKIQSLRKDIARILSFLSKKAEKSGSEVAQSDPLSNS